MRYKRFVLQKYKGISQELTLDLGDKPCCLLGDNEAGKTTILKGINQIGSLLRGAELKNGELNELRPLSLSFTGDVSLSTTLSYRTNEEFEWPSNKASKDKIQNSLKIDPNDPSGDEHELVVQFLFTFEDSKFQKRADKLYMDKDEVEFGNAIHNFLRNNVPEIVYFDDFDFDIPNFVRLSLPSLKEDERSDKEEAIRLSNNNRRWEGIFEDLLCAVLEKRDASLQDNFIALVEDDPQTKQTRLVAMNNYLNKAVGDRWVGVVGEEKKFDTINIREETSNAGYLDLHININAGNRPFRMANRSKGFRWFFCFILMTVLRRWRHSKGLVLLLDEPANNIFFSRQGSILKSILDGIKTNGQTEVSLVFSTHSSGMIDQQETDIFCCANLKSEEFSEDNISIQPELTEDCKRLVSLASIQKIINIGIESLSEVKVKDILKLIIPNLAEDMATEAYKFFKGILDR